MIQKEKKSIPVPSLGRNALLNVKHRSGLVAVASSAMDTFPSCHLHSPKSVPPVCESMCAWAHVHVGAGMWARAGKMKRLITDLGPAR